MKSYFILIICTFLIAFLYAQPGSLDYTFGTGGKVITPVGNSIDYARSVVVQPDGKIVLAGYSCSDSNYYTASLVRYNTNGSLDNSFGSGGKVMESGYTAINSAVLQPDGKIVIAGYGYYSGESHFALARFSGNGILDSTFGTNGKVYTVIVSDNDFINSAALQSDGKIVVAGYCHSAVDADFVIARYNSNGNLDTTFGTDGKIITVVGNSWDSPFSVLVQVDGKIVVSGYTVNGAEWRIAVLRYNSNGSLDNNFGNGGVKITSIEPSYHWGGSAVLQQDGKIVVVCGPYIDTLSHHPFISLLRFNTNGSLDNSFGVGGRVKTIDINACNVQSIAIQPDGKIIIPGELYVSTETYFSVYRYLSNGSLDNSFGNGGKVITDISSGASSAFSVALQVDGKIVTAGVTYNNGTQDFAAARYNVSDCQAFYSLYPDTIIQHNWFAVNLAGGVAPINYSWNWDDGNTSSGANPSHIYAVAANYNICLSITDGNGCTATYCDSSIYIYKTEQTIISINVVSQTSSVTETKIDDLVLRISPNPTTSSFTISIDETMLGSALAVYDITGKKMMAAQLENINTKLSTQNFAKGIYIVTVTGKEHEWKQKLVIE